MADAHDVMLLTAAHKALDVLRALYKHMDEIAEARGHTARAQAIADLLRNLHESRRVIYEMVEQPLRAAIVAKGT